MREWSLLNSELKTSLTHNLSSKQPQRPHNDILPLCCIGDGQPAASRYGYLGHRYVGHQLTLSSRDLLAHQKPIARAQLKIAYPRLAIETTVGGACSSVYSSDDLGVNKGTSILSANARSLGYKGCTV